MMRTTHLRACAHTCVEGAFGADVAYPQFVRLYGEASEASPASWAGSATACRVHRLPQDRQSKAT